MLTFVLRCRHTPYPHFTAVLTPEQESAADGVVVALQAKQGVRAALHALAMSVFKTSVNDDAWQTCALCRFLVVSSLSKGGYLLPSNSISPGLSKVEWTLRATFAYEVSVSAESGTNERYT